jgi:hypothetical protein
MHRPLYLPSLERATEIHWTEDWAGPQILSGRCGEIKNYLALSRDWISLDSL